MEISTPPPHPNYHRVSKVWNLDHLCLVFAHGKPRASYSTLEMSKWCKVSEHKQGDGSVPSRTFSLSTKRVPSVMFTIYVPSVTIATMAFLSRDVFLSGGGCQTLITYALRTLPRDFEDSRKEKSIGWERSVCYAPWQPASNSRGGGSSVTNHHLRNTVQDK